MKYVVFVAVAAACGSSDKIPDTHAGTAPAQGPVDGHVVDSETLAPIAGVTLTIGGAMTTTGPDGAFHATVATGKQTVVAGQTGYLPWLHTIAVGGESFPLTIRMVAQAPVTTIDAAGGSIAAGPATVTVPANAYATPTQVSVTYLPRTRVGSFPGDARWVDTTAHTHRVHEVLHLGLSALPTAPFTIALPVPADANATKLMLYRRMTDGTWGSPIAPDSVAGGVATFTRTPAATVRTEDDEEDDDLDEDTGDDGEGTVEGDDDSDVPTTAEENQVELMNLDSGQPQVVLNGDYLPMAQHLVTGANQSVRIMYADGTEVVVGPNTQFTATWTPYSQGGSVLQNLYGKLRAVVRRQVGNEYAPVIGPANATMGVRGTAFTFDVTPCPHSSGPQLHTGTVEVTDGVVDAIKAKGSVAEQSALVTAGQSYTYCCLECGVGAVGSCCKQDGYDGGIVDSGRTMQDAPVHNSPDAGQGPGSHIRDKPGP